MNAIRFEQLLKTLSNFVLINLLLITSLSVVVKAEDANNSKDGRPNILWIISEDNSKHYLKLYDGAGTSMPNIDALAAEGLIFNNAFSNSPVCSTARSTLASGIYDTRLGTANHRAYQKSKLPEGVKAFSQMLKNAGYYTSNNSKTDYNFVEEGKPWNESSKKANWKNRAQSQPFFHVQTFMTTHEGRLHFKQSAIAHQKTRHNPDEVKIAPIYPDTKTFRYTMARTLDNHRKVDNQIGKLLQQLKQDGELENTFVFYFGDHGGVLPGSKGYIFERGLHVPLVVRVPENYKHLVASDLRKENTRIDGFVSFIDFAPTVLTLAGVEKSPEHDGKPFLTPDLDLQKLNQRDIIFAQAGRFDEKSDLVRSVRKGNFKYIRHYQPYYSDSLYSYYRYKQLAYKEWKQLYREGKLNPVQASFFEPKTPEALYDISIDPYETNNLANAPEQQEKLVVLRSLLQQHIKSLPDVGFIPESTLIDKSNNSAFMYGKQQHQSIGQLVDIADLQLQNFSAVKKRLTHLLQTGSAEQKYWALITLSSFGAEAEGLVATVERLLKKSISTQVKGRAIEFLASVGTFDPVKPLTELILNAKQAMEKVELLNIATFLNESKGYQFPQPPGLVLQEPVRGTNDFKINTWLKVRWEYISKKS